MNLRGRPPQSSAARQPFEEESDWMDYERHFRRVYREAVYYSTGRGWPDYAPAYRYGYESYGRFGGRRFDEVEAQLEHDWDAGRAESRLAWAEARGAIRDIWQLIDQDISGERGRSTDRRQ